MKKLIVILLLSLTQEVNAQVTLENIYPNTIGNNKFLMLTKLDSTTFKYLLFDQLGSQFTIYNLNHSVFMNVSIPITYVFGSSQYTIAYVTKSLFDCDSSNIEYALSFLGSGSPTSYPKKFYVYRTDGTQLANIDSCCFMNYSNGWQYGPLYNEPIVKTPLGSKLILRCLDGSTRVFSVCGNLSTLISESIEKDILGSPFPNPTKDFITIPYSLPDNERSGILRIFDLSGKEIKSYSVDNTYDNIRLTTEDLSNGTYYYQISTSKGQQDTKKIIKVE